MMSPCESSPGSLLVGCLATGFSPAESVNFKWMDQRGNSLTNFIQYPTVGTGNKMLKVSHITINEAEWNQSKIICEAGHPSGNVTETFTTVKPQTPTLSLVLVTTLKSTSVMCVIEDFYPKKIDVQWKVNNTNSMSQLKLERKLNDTGHYTAYSFYEVSRENWDVNTQYTCEVTHRGKPFTTTAYFKAKFALTLKPPIQREIFLKNEVVLEAVVSGDIKDTVEKASVSCSVKEARIDVRPGTVKFSNDISQFIKKHNVTVDTKKWFDGEMVTCTTSDTNNNGDIEQKIRFHKGDEKKPSVTIYKPDSNVTDPVSLVCEVTSLKLGDVYIMWRVGKEPYREGTTSAPIHQKDSTSVLSILTMTKEEYNNIIICAVKHANMDNISAPLQASTSQSKQPELSCD
ncbi:Ig heavy chain C region, secreted form [Sinocyclocheilus rhinocerous]|uniref:Ig heavy chain C region, secreted form n=1 Tax=Sinocyclocheilus rhinocerous TaxID=307959 RepID=UPI003D9A6976